MTIPSAPNGPNGPPTPDMVKQLAFELHSEAMEVAARAHNLSLTALSLLGLVTVQQSLSNAPPPGAPPAGPAAPTADATTFDADGPSGMRTD